MQFMNPDVASSTASLRSAISRMRNGPPAPQIPFFLQWHTTGRHYLNEWVADLEITMDAAATAVTGAREAGLGGPGRRELELGLWRIDSAADKLIKVLAIAIGVQVLRLNKAGTGVLFRPDPRLVISKLSQFPLTNRAVQGLMALLQVLRDHPARRLRNDVSHSLSPVGALTPLTHLALVYVQDGHQQVPEARMLYTDSVLIDNDMRPEAIWKQILAEANDALIQLTKAVAQSAEVIESVGRLEPPPTVYYDLDAKRASLEPLGNAW